MKILFYFASLLVLVLTKEDLSGLDQYLQDPNFWQFVEKRLGSKNDIEPKAPAESPSKVKDQYDPFGDHSDGDTSAAKNDKTPEHRDDLMEDTLGNLCQYRPNASLIIRSKASINNGAFFLKSFNRRTQKECVNACCYTQSCNLVVYENKDEHSCYLFNCGTPSKCLFAEHANYTSLFFPNHVAPSTSINGHQEQHENELEGLNSKVTLKPTTQAPRRKVPLYGKCDIDWNDECSDRNAECRDRECKCSYGYHAKYGICRANCPESEFECENKGQRVNVPECISREHVCDGQPQCADGSDENKCPDTALTTTTSTSTTTTTTPKPVTTKSSQQNVNNLGVNDQILPQYFPTNLNKLPTGSDLYNGNGYYWPSGYGRMYGSQSYPYGRFQPGAQYPFDPRFYNSYDSSGRQFGNGYLDPVRGYYDKSVPDSKSVSSQTGSGNGRAGSPKSDHSNEKLIPISQGRDGASAMSSSGKKGSDFKQKIQVKTTEKPTTVSPTSRQATTRGSFNTWKISNQQTDWDKTSKDTTGWRGNFDKDSQKQINHDIPSWKSDEGTQKSAQESQNKWENVMDSSQNTKYDQVLDNTDKSLGKGPLKQHTSSDKMDWQKSFHVKQQTKGGTADKIQTGKQDLPVLQSGSDKQRNWNQHTESSMDNNDKTDIEAGMKGGQVDESKGRVSEGRSESGESKDKTSGGYQGKSDRWHQHQGWTAGRNKDMGQTSNRHKGQDNRNGKGHPQERTRGGSKGRKGGGYHRKQNVDNTSSRLTDNTNKGFKSKQQIKPQNTDYDNYFQESSQNRQNVAGPKKQGYRKPAYKSQKPQNYQYYDGYRPDPYWNYDYYNYNDHSDKKYPSPYDQTDSDNDRNWFNNKPDSDDDDNDDDDDNGNKQKPTPKVPPKPTPRPTQKIKTTQAPEIKHVDPTAGKIKPGGANSASTTDKKPQVSSSKTEKIQTSKKNSTDSKVPDSEGLLEEAVQTHVVVESPTDSHQGPIVALALGLGITVILLFFVGCRLRNVKRRIRKGRALHSNEADYLINGMYL
ncbi:uncharacterized protein LOC133171625 [Saccostrea echinata]|uniref:uncharacterized protein LOC133171625 n=1 Tax=Saccostrea echinata TaxID=191078 RepID=UPI002A804D76|nr:uncharacterized protein LOC133171625 [Saccostrea echinata]